MVGLTDASAMTDLAKDPPVLDAEQLQQYFARIGLDERFRCEPIVPSLELLKAIIERHLYTVPFEQLDVALGRGINPDLSVVFEKIVTVGRGGYCFESNMLLGACLRGCGFKITTIPARVVIGGEVSARSHILHVVSFGSDDAVEYLVDCAFGGHSLREPMPLKPMLPPALQQDSTGNESVVGKDSTGNGSIVGKPMLMFPDAFRLVVDTRQYEAPGGLILQRFDAEKWSELQESTSDVPPDTSQLEACWASLYAFHPRSPLWNADIDAGNWWVSTQMKDNWFTATRLILKFTPTGRKIMSHYTMSDVNRIGDDDLKLLFPDGLDLGRTRQVLGEVTRPQGNSSKGVMTREIKTVTPDEYLDFLKAEFGTDLSWDHRTGETSEVSISSFMAQCLTAEEQQAPSSD
jgi:arylamine N-acetyltransferase